MVSWFPSIYKFAKLKAKFSRNTKIEEAVSQIRAELHEVTRQRDLYKAKVGEAVLHYDLSYNSDSLITWNKSTDFMADPIFMSAYRRGMDSGHVIGRPAGSSDDIHIEWRIAICCWAAWHARHLDGDFVECGTNTGIMSLAVCDYIDFNSCDKSFWLFDTFSGIPVEQIDENEKASGRAAENHLYPECFEIAQKNFSPFPRAKLVRGKVPGSLNKVSVDKVCYLCIDMNITYPEIEALKFFWPKMVSGAVVIFDDYGWLGYRAQKQAHDAFAHSQGVKIFNLPTGQGLLIKP